MNAIIDDENILFCFKEKEDNNKEKDIQKIMSEFENLSDLNKISDLNKGDLNEDIMNDNIYYENNGYGYENNETFYEQEYTIKDLIKICNYYGIDKYIKSSKCKKQDIITTLVYFESQPENIAIVQQRNKMWTYMIEMLNDPKMKKYIIF